MKTCFMSDERKLMIKAAAVFFLHAQHVDWVNIYGVDNNYD